MKKSLLKHIVELSLTILFVILVRSVLFEPYLVPSSSMLPNLLEGDRIVVNKYIYGISRYSFPFSPKIFKGRVLEFSQPKRGDVVVFELDKVYVKRLVGEPGDKIQVVNGTLYINGNEIKQTLLKDKFTSGNISFSQYAEKLTDQKTITILDFNENTDFDNTPVHAVPEGHYFFMGDNRDFSRDSRDIYFMGFVPKENILGRVTHIFFSSATLETYNLFGMVRDFRLNRTFQKVN
ncbi:MAG: signal peptidase I [Rickettsiales bacterium]|nr:signal peptidase I [Rickettsiales bacterium]